MPLAPADQTSKNTVVCVREWMKTTVKLHEDFASKPTKPCKEIISTEAKNKTTSYSQQEAKKNSI